MSKTNIETTANLVDPALLTNEELAELLPEVDRIADWCKKVQETATGRLLTGEVVPGFKLIESSSREKITNEDGLAAKLIEAGYTREIIYETNLRTLTDLRRIIGNKEFKDLSVGFTEKPKGNPKLVKETDKGTAYVNTDFDHIINGGK